MLPIIDEEKDGVTIILLSTEGNYANLKLTIQRYLATFCNHVTFRKTPRFTIADLESGRKSKKPRNEAQNYYCGPDGTRTRDLLRDRQAF